jgi:uncharacterized protein (TIGR02996 family)
VSELSALLEAVRLSREDDTPRLVFADWLDEHYPQVDVLRGELPPGFNAYWIEHSVAYTLCVRSPHLRPRRRWPDADIFAALAASAEQMRVNWSARIGAAEIGGYPVLVSEPQMKQGRALPICRALQWGAGGCPVSFNRCPQRGRLRIAFWFTALPSPEQRSEETTAALEEIFCNPTPQPARPNAMAEAMAILQPGWKRPW